MVSEDALERFFASFAHAAEAPAIGRDEAAVVLDLARVTAHSSERRYAPIAAYVAGLSIGPGVAADASTRIKRLRYLTDLVEQMGSSDTPT